MASVSLPTRFDVKHLHPVLLHLKYLDIKRVTGYYSG
jgi:hypothetical protein